MQRPSDIRMGAYDYPLAEEKIAKFPLSERDASKLLIYRNGSITDSAIADLPAQLPIGTALFFNNSKVVQARLRFQRATGAGIEIFCLAPSGGKDPEQAFQVQGSVEWECMVGNLKKWKEGEVLTMRQSDGQFPILLSAERGERTADGITVKFHWQPATLSFAEVMEMAGEIPLPPYLNRRVEVSDKVRYQTIYARAQGSVAAPTAGLHFTAKVFENLKNKGIEKHWLTLHVGAGTFKPVKSELVGGHEMHWERISVSLENVETLLSGSGKVVAVGTTSARTLESLFWIGVQLSKAVALEPTAHFHVSQWEPYDQDCNLTLSQALEAVQRHMKFHGIGKITASTQLMIAPGYKFRVIDGLVTNFHQPGSTLLLLVAALIGEDWKKVYDHALKNDYRFLSYGDSCLFWPREVSGGEGY